MPRSYVYGLKIINDLTGKFEYSPPFKIHIPGSTFSSSSSKTTQSKSRSTSTPSSTVAKSASTRTHATEPSSSTPSKTTPGDTKQNTRTSATSSSAASSQMASTSDNDGKKMDLVYKALGGGIGGFALVVVIVAVWRRVRNENRKMAAMEALGHGKSFRDPRLSLDDDDSPILVKGHRRFPSTSSFGDGARPSDLMDRPVMKPTNQLSPIADSPPPTPFAAPPLKLPSNCSQRRAEENPTHPFPISGHYKNMPGPHEAPGRGWDPRQQPGGMHSQPQGPPPSSRALMSPPIPAEARSTTQGLATTTPQRARDHFPSYNAYTPHPPGRRDPTMDNHPT